MRRVELILGPPGTGKTHHLLREVAAALAAGTPPERIGFFSFTRQAAKEAITRATAELGLTADRFIYFKTLHAMSYQLLGLRKHEVMRRQHFVELGELLGLEFSQAVDHETQRVAYSGKLGDKLLSLYGLSRAKGISVSQQWEQGHYYEFPRHVAETFAQHLQEFKAYHGLHDFSDFLERCHEALDVDLFILDEAQDLTPQEWAMAKRLAAKAKRVIIAGDDDQAIFTWAGSDVRRLLALRAERRVLPISHRLPGEIFNLANSISAKISVRFQKDWQPRKAGGVIDLYPPGGEEHVDLGPGEWLLLARHRHQLAKLERIARQAGRTYKIDDKDITTSDVAMAVRWYEQLRADKAALQRSQLLHIAKYVRDLSLDALKHDRPYQYHEVPWPWAGRPDWMAALNNLDADDVEYLRSVRRAGGSLTLPPTVRITTIHGSKGAEADNVLLLTQASKRTREAALMNPDDEHRVWYVGVSRARERLVLAGPNYFV